MIPNTQTLTYGIHGNQPPNLTHSNLLSLSSRDDRPQGTTTSISMIAMRRRTAQPLVISLRVSQRYLPCREIRSHSRVECPFRVAHRPSTLQEWDGKSQQTDSCSWIVSGPPQDSESVRLMIYNMTVQQNRNCECTHISDRRTELNNLLPIPICSMVTQDGLPVLATLALGVTKSVMLPRLRNGDLTTSSNFFPPAPSPSVLLSKLVS